MVRFVVNTHRPTHHHQRVERPRFRQRLVGEQARHRELVAARVRPRADPARGLERYMLQTMNVHGVTGAAR
jgi:hypothetical protein